MQKGRGLVGAKTASGLFPTIYHLGGAQYEAIFEGMLKNIAQRGEGSIKFEEAAYTLNINRLKDWIAFLADVFLKLKEINFYMRSTHSMKGSFTLENNTIVYKK